MLKLDEAVLVVVDIQDKLMPKDPEVVASMLACSKKLVQAAGILGMPILAAEQNPERLGESNAEILEVLGETPRFGKMEFGCLDNVAFREALEAAGRRQLLIIGMETHVCVLQTALTAAEAGYEVFVVRDAVMSMAKAEYKAGLARMAQGGVQLVSTLMAIFELLGKAGTPEFKAMLPLLK